MRLATPVTSVRRTEHHAHVRTVDGDEATFDAVIIATHADQALSILAAPTPEQRQVLGAFGYSRNVTTLHTDTRLLPRARRAWASWNYRLAVVLGRLHERPGELPHELVAGSSGQRTTTWSASTPPR